MLKVKDVHNLRYAVKSTHALRAVHISAACRDHYLRPAQMFDSE